MFCPKCGTRNPEGAAHCGNCGADLAPRTAQPTEQTGPQGGTAVIGTAGKLQNPKMVAIIAAIVVVLVILLIRFVACSGPNTPNLVDITTKPSADAAKILQGYDEVNDGGYSYFTNNPDFANYWNNGSDGNTTLNNMNGSFVLSAYDYDGNLTMSDMMTGDNPSHVYYYEVVARDNLTAKDVADIANRVAPYDKVVTYASGSDYLSGMSKGNGCVSNIYANRNGSVWVVDVDTYSINEDSYGSSYADDFDDEYATFDASNYTDSYKN